MSTSQTSQTNESELSPLRILAVEDSEFDRLLVMRELRKLDLPFHAEWVDSEVDFLHQLENSRPHLILCDFSLPQFGALRALTLLDELSLNIPLIIVTGTLTDEMAVDCLKKGAVDYVIKDKIVRLIPAIKRALEHRRAKLEKLEAEQRLKRSERQLKTITGVLPASLTYISRDGKFQFYNKVHEEWFGKDVLDKPIGVAFGEENFANIQIGIQKLVSGGQFAFEGQLPTAYAPQFVKFTLVPDFEKDAGVKGYVCLITDITEAKRNENELKNAKESADAANKAKTQFLANMSHEMRTPLHVIQGLSELLQTDYRNAEDRSIWIEKISRNCVHLKRVIDEILDLSKVESGTLQVERTRFPLADVIADLRSTLSPLAREKKISLAFEIKGSVPKYITSDRVKLRHILLNVAGNAVKFSQSGTILVQARWEEPRGLIFLIKDQAGGIAPIHAKELFKPFMQADNSMTRRFGGTGLGLAIARSFAVALGGTVELVESTVGLGSTFSISIDPGPVKDGEMIHSIDTTLVQSELPAEATPPVANLKDMSVLLVEDSEDNQLLVRAFLEAEEVAVDVASNGQEGINKVLSGAYDLILMDVQMPVLDGYSATSRLRHSGCNTPIIAFTAHAFQEERERCLSGGFNAFLTKPIKKSELLACVSRFRRPA